MLDTFLKGAAIGFSISILFLGPSFFALIQASIKNGFRSAVAMAAGVSMSDIFLVCCAYFGVQRFIDNPRNKDIEGIVGSVILIGFGIFTLFQKNEDIKEAEKGMEAVSNVKRLAPMFIKGFFLNLLNPLVLLFWVGWLATVAQYSRRQDMIALFVGTLGTVFTMDVLKSLLANRLKKLITHRLLKWVHYIMAIALIISGIVLMYDLLSGKTGGA